MPIAPAFPPAGPPAPAPGPSPSPSSNIIAEWDFSKIGNVDLLAGGDGAKTLDPTTGATGKSWQLFNAASNTGANAVMAVDGGILKIQADGVTSMFGKSYWSSNHTPFLAIKLQDFSSTLASDTLLQEHTYIAELEIDAGPSTTNPNNDVPHYQYLHVGLVNNLSSYTAGNGFPNNGMLTGPRATNNSYPQGAQALNIYNGGASFSYTGLAWTSLNNNLNEPGWRDFGEGGSGLNYKYIVNFNQASQNIWTANDNYRRGIVRQYGDTNKNKDQQPIGAASLAASNDIWLLVGSQQSTSSAVAGKHWKVKKITIKELKE